MREREKREDKITGFDQLPQSAPGPHLLPAAVGRDRPLRGSSQRRPVVVEVAGRIHLVLRRGDTHS